MREITLQSVPVLVDGGPYEGQLVLTDGHLVAVLTQVPAEETAGGERLAGGWYLEAGFGPCGDIMSITPPVFVSLEEAVEWVRVRLEAGFAPS
jgi:hypothetical protein